ncbi:DNA transfer protein p32 [Burkholderia territorii]|uniref:DNA transfer protein p32 n=1 Tax=Burkholderia territorii TaxID=1503055 RepID=UPI000A8E427C|nr:DNA transfer protein p32 [Burkholderia territorii]
MVAAAIGGAAVAGLAGSAMQAGAASDAASAQADAANNAAGLQWQQFQQMQKNLQPYMNLGTNNIQGMQDQLAKLGGMQFSFNPTEAQLEQTPGYQFTLQQGLKNTNNALAAKGLNLSGAQAKGLSQYTTGLADQTFQQQYQNALQQFATNYGVNTDQFNRLSGLVGLGENAAAGVGNAGLQTASNAGNILMSGANARAAGTVGSANAISNGLSSLGGNGLLYSLMNNNAGGAGGFYGGNFSTGISPADYATSSMSGLGGLGYGY